MTEHESNYKIQIDPDLQELIPGFLKNRRCDIDKINKSLAEKDYESISLIGHTMKGNGSSYGFDKISELGKQIEAAARQQQSEQIKQLVAALFDFITHLDIEYI